jgi:hypothetical protein
MNQKEFLKVFPNFDTFILDKINLVEFYLATNAKTKYKFDFSFNITDEIIEYGHTFTKTEINDNLKIVKSYINLEDFKNVFSNHLVGFEDDQPSIFGSLVATMVNSYVRSICHMFYPDEMDHDNPIVTELLLDVININFISTILQYPEEQVRQKLGMALDALYRSDEFSSVQELKEFVFNRLSKVSEKIIFEHSHFCGFFGNIMREVIEKEQERQRAAFNPGQPEASDNTFAVGYVRNHDLN